jgi:hypothetical protein
LIDRPTEKPWGAGEPTAAVVPSAISNAIFDAIGEDSLSAVQSGKTTADLKIDNVTVRQRVSVTRRDVTEIEISSAKSASHYQPSFKHLS